METFVHLLRISDVLPEWHIAKLCDPACTMTFIKLFIKKEVVVDFVQYTEQYTLVPSSYGPTRPHFPHY